MVLEKPMNADLSRRLGAVADWLALACLAAMASVPFLIARHYNPIPSFWSEWWAFAFGLSAAALLLVRPSVWRPMALPGVVLIPFAFLVMALLQYALGHWYFIEPWLLYMAYLIWASLLMLAAHSFVARRGLAPLANVLAAALLFSTLSNTVAAALQFHQVGVRSGWVFIRLGDIPYSNLGQANHFNHQLWLGIASLYYLHLQGRCRIVLALPALLILLFAATLTASKSILLYATALALLAGLMRWQRADDAPARRLWRTALPLLPLVLLLQWIANATHIAGDTSLATQRLFGEVAGFQIRWRLLQAAWDIFTQAPLLGSGIGTLPWQFFIANGSFPLGQGPAVAEHTHNLPLQLLAEFGVVPVVVMAVILARWMLGMWRRGGSVEQWWLVALLSIAAIHSLLEYPLWYSFFLGIAALLLGAADRTAFAIHNGIRGAVLSAIVIAVGIAPLATLRADYTTLEKRVNNLAPAASSATAWQATIADLLDIQRDSLLAPYVMLSLAAAMEVDDKQLDDKVEVCQHASRFAPTRRIVFKCAALMAIKGEAGEAHTLMKQSLDAYPGEARRVAGELGSITKRYPALTPLVAMARDYERRMAALTASANGARP